MQFNKKTQMWESPYFHPAVTTDAVVLGFDGEALNVLLIKRGLEPYKGMWALPGGFLKQDDLSAYDCVNRELREETNIEVNYLEELKTFSEINRDTRERVITIAFFALVDQSRYKVIGGDDAVDAQWFSVNDLPKLAFDHEKIVATALETLRRQIHFEPIGFYLLNKLFTMPELQNIYLAILDPDEADMKLRDRRNFVKKMLKLGYIRDTGKKQTGNPYRSPKLYTFDAEVYAYAKKIGMRLEF